MSGTIVVQSSWKGSPVGNYGFPFGRFWFDEGWEDWHGAIEASVPRRELWNKPVSKPVKIIVSEGKSQAGV